MHKHCLWSVHAQMFAKPPVKRQCLCVRKHATTGSSVLAYLNPYTQSLMPFLVSVSREHGRTSCRRTTWGAYSDTQFSCHSIIGAQRAWLAKTASEPPRPQITSAPAREIYMRRPHSGHSLPPPRVPAAAATAGSDVNVCQPKLLQDCGCSAICACSMDKVWMGDFWMVEKQSG